MGVVKSFLAAIIATILLSSFASAKVNDRDKEYFRQLEALYECTRRVSTGISHFIGAVG